MEKELNFEELKKELEKCEKKRDEYLAGWKRARADFINYKKGEIERVGELMKFAATGLILKVLPILDNFDLAEKNLSEDSKKEESIKGFLQIKTQIKDFLEEQGIDEISCLEEKFDPNFHEAVEEVEMKDKESGIIIEEIQKGYKFQGRVIRPNKVKVIK